LILSRQAPKPIGEREEVTTAEDISRAEMEQWDEKFAKSTVVESEESTETARDVDS
jgi:predicted metal-binding transcription factor (methanogenesis marker protein 9)